METLGTSPEQTHGSEDMDQHLSRFVCQTLPLFDVFFGVMLRGKVYCTPNRYLSTLMARIPEGTETVTQQML